MKEVVFIVGAGRSGSTILDMFLGGAPNAFSTGELVRIFDENARQNVCTCSLSLENCEVWKSIISNRDLTSKTKIRSSIYGKFYDFANILYSYKFNSKLKNQSYDKNIQINYEILDELFQVTKSDVIIDSSKDILRALLLEKKLRNTHKVNFIFLTRNGIDNALSRTKKYYYLGDKKIEKPKHLILTFRKGIISWVLVNLKNVFLLRLFNKEYYHLRYEDLVNHNAEFIKKFKSRSIIELSNDMIDFSNKEYHLINGNPSRFNATGIEQKFSAKQKRDLSLIRLCVYHILGGSLMNKLLGY